jgi:protein arginine N-methyltransferase 1
MQVAIDNGCDDRITFIRDDSRRVTLPERGDVLLSDLRGVLPLFEAHIATIVDARARLVRPGATLVARRDTMWIAPCAAPAGWRRDHAEMGDDPHGIDRRAVAARVRSDWYRCRLGPGDMSAGEVEWATLDYTTIESPNVEGRAEWTFEHEGISDGLVVWFDADFGFGVTLSNAPLGPRTLYGQAFFPFERAMHVKAGDRLTAELRANCVSGDYVWSWNSTLVPAAAASEPVSFRQSNLASHVVSLSRLRELSSAGRAESRG